MSSSAFPRALHLIALFFIFLLTSTVFALPTLMPEIGAGLQQFSLLASAVIGLAVPCYVAYRWAGRPEIDWGLSTASIKMVGMGLLLVLCCSLFVSGVLALLGLDSSLGDYMKDLMSSGWAVALVAVISAPILEEILCRRLIMGEYLKKGRTPFNAMFISAVFFGVLHLHPIHVVPAILMGLALGFIYWRTGSLMNVILIHFLNNALATVLYYADPDSASSSLLEDVGGSYPAITGIIVGAAGLGYLLYRGIDRFAGSVGLTSGEESMVRAELNE